MARSRTIWKDGQLFAEYVDGVCVWLNPNYKPPARSDVIKTPYVVRDIGEYTSIVDGTVITSRSQHREHLKAHDMIEVGNERMPSAPSAPSAQDKRALGEAIKRRLDEVQEMPQHQYDAHVQQQATEHAEISALVTAAA